MTEQLDTTLTFVWDGECGRVDVKAFQQLMAAEDGVVLMDFLADIIDEATRLYNNGVDSGALWRRAAT